jgi:hypothetical protein
MNRAALILATSALLIAAPAAAQWTGMPVWNSPKGGTGITISGDWGKPDSTYGKGNAFGARASLGLSALTFTAGVASYKPEGLNDRTTSVGGQVDFRVIGGSLLPVAVSVQAGAGVSGKITAGATPYPKITTVTGAVGFSVPLPTPGVSIEPYFAPGLRYRRETERGGALPNRSDTKFAYVIGANASFGMFGLHLAYDYQDSDAGDITVFGLGAHVDLRLPGGF